MRIFVVYPCPPNFVYDIIFIHHCFPHSTRWTVQPALYSASHSCSFPYNQYLPISVLSCDIRKITQLKWILGGTGDGFAIDLNVYPLILLVQEGADNALERALASLRIFSLYHLVNDTS